MDNAKHIGRVGALAVALGVGNVRRTATRMTVSIGAAALVVMATVVPASTVSPAVRLSATQSKPDSTALLLCGTTCPTPDDYWVESVKNQFIAPTHPGQDIDYVAVTTPEEFWPLTGILRLLGLALGPPELFGPGGPAWPDEPLWKLSGLFDLTADQSLRAGVADLEAAMAKHGNDHLVIHGDSQGAGIANVEKRKLAEQYPAGTKAPDIDFVLNGDPNLPNGGLASRFPGLYIPILDLSFNGPAPTDTQFDTVEINQQYDGFTDLPLYPLNVISLLNAVLGIFYVHLYPFDISLPPDPRKTSPAYQGKYGDTDYYFFETQDLPLFGPLRTLGVPEPVIDVVEPFFKVIVDLGYDRSIPPWKPTPARLFPTLDLGKAAADLVEAIGEGINNGAALVGLPSPVKSPLPATLSAPGVETTKEDVAPQVRSIETSTRHDELTLTEPVDSEKAQKEPTAVNVPEVPKTSAGVSTSELTKPGVRPPANRPMVRGLTGVGERVRDLLHRGDGSHRYTRTTDSGDRKPDKKATDKKADGRQALGRQALGRQALGGRLAPRRHRRFLTIRCSDYPQPPPSIIASAQSMCPS